MGIISPILPIYAEELGATGVWLGLIFSGFAFGEASDYAEVPAGSYNLEVRLASEPAGRGTLVKTFEGVSLESTTTYSIFATRLAAELNAKAVQDNE